MKASYKMRKTIERAEKKFGKLEKVFFIEKDERVRIGRGIYCGCELTCKTHKHLNIIIAHDGTSNCYELM